MNTKTTRPVRRTLIALTLSALLAAVPARAINAILNDNFISGTDPWSLKLASGAAATLDNDAGWGRVLITNGGSSKSAVAFEQPLSQPLIAGVTYTIAFDARADATKSIDVLLRSTSPAATIYSSTYGISVGTSSTRTTITYTHGGSDVSDAKISLRIGGNLTPLYIDNVVVTRQGSPSQLLSKVGGVWQFNTLSVGGKSWNAGTYDFSYAGYNYGEREAFTGIPASTQTISAVANEDITDKINAALAALPSGGTVIIPAGTFRIGAGKTGKAISVTTDNTVIKGAGMGVTTLKVDATYHAATDLADRQDATFASGVINFYKTNSGGWFYGSIQPNSATVSATVPLGARTITVSDPYNKITTATGIVIRQIMWSSLVSSFANNPSYNPKPLRWTDYDSANVPLFSDPSYSFCYYRRILSRSGNVLTLDAPIPHELNPVNAMITVTSRAPSAFLNNSGLQDLTLTADPEDGVANPEDSLGATVMVTGVLDGLFKNVDIDSFRNLGIATTYAVNTSFLNCTTANAFNCGGGGSGYGFYIKGQNLLYKNCNAINVRHGYTTAASQTCNIVIKNCSSIDYRFHTSVTTGGESVDDTHLQLAHGILWDNHYSNEAGLLMINRRELSPRAYATCGWSIVWNYENEGFNTLDAYGKDLRHNLLGVTPAEFGMVIGAHAGQGPAGIRIKDGYTRENTTQSSADWGIDITTPTLQVGSQSNRVLFELATQPVAESLYDIQFAQRTKLLP
jgi:hypothetical protein